MLELEEADVSIINSFSQLIQHVAIPNTASTQQFITVILWIRWLSPTLVGAEIVEAINICYDAPHVTEVDSVIDVADSLGPRSGEDNTIVQAGYKLEELVISNRMEAEGFSRTPYPIVTLRVDGR